VFKIEKKYNPSAGQADPKNRLNKNNGFVRKVARSTKKVARPTKK
jgi:hypothetical protein